MNFEEHNEIDNYKYSEEEKKTWEILQHIIISLRHFIVRKLLKKPTFLLLLIVKCYLSVMKNWKQEGLTI